MPFSVFSLFTRRLAGVLAVVALAGCASMSPSPEAAVRVRAAEVAKARVANDFDSAYLFTPPSFRAVTPLAGYKNTFVGPVQWTSAEVDSVLCETQDKCLARMKVQAKPLARPRSGQAPSFTSYFDEAWIRENGQWWLFPTP